MALDFERPLLDLEERIRELEASAKETGVDLGEEIAALGRRLERTRRDTFGNLTRWQRVQLARAPGRPTSLDHIERAFTDFGELHGDRAQGDDPAIVGGLARLEGRPLVVIGQQKGRDTKENITRNFGMVHPEGFRKAMRLMDLAEKFGLPVVTLIDTPGAYPGVAAEERGVAWLISESIRRMTRLRVPVVAAVIGEGGSGGALALAVANRVLILENAVYSVITPEGAATIIWRDAKEAPKAAEALKPTATDLLEQGVVDEVVPEPPGGAHADLAGASVLLGAALARHLGELQGLSPEALVADRAERFRRLGAYAT